MGGVGLFGFCGGWIGVGGGVVGDWQFGVGFGRGVCQFVWLGLGFYCLVYCLVCMFVMGVYCLFGWCCVGYGWGDFLVDFV